MNKITYSKNSPEAIIRLLYAMAYADKFISEEEIKIITEIEKSYSVSKDTSANIIEDIKKDDIEHIQDLVTRLEFELWKLANR